MVHLSFVVPHGSEAAKVQFASTPAGEEPKGTTRWQDVDAYSQSERMLRCKVRFDSRPLDRRALARIGVAPQELALYPDLSGEENLRFFASAQGLAGRR